MFCLAQLWYVFGLAQLWYVFGVAQLWFVSGLWRPSGRKYLLIAYEIE